MLDILMKKPHTLTGQYLQRMTDEDFFDFCQSNDEWSFERDANKNILFMPPTGSLTSHLNNNINYQITHWNRTSKTGKVFDSNGGFTLPDGSQRAPDAAWVSNEQWNQLSQEDKEKFAPICPEFIVELRSKNDNLDFLKDKMQMWIRNGVQLAWLIDPQSETTYIYRNNGSIDVVEGFDKKLLGELVLPDFEFDLSEIKE